MKPADPQVVPPPFASRLLRLFCKPEYLEDILGDLEEEFQERKEREPTKNHRWWYLLEVIRLFRPSIIKKVSIQLSIEKELSMYKNYFKIGFRNLWKYKSSSLINISGLSIGLSAFILVALFIKDELSYDRHHEHAQQIYRLTVKNFNTEGDLSRHWAFASAGHASRFKEDYPEVTHATRFYPWAFPDLVVGDRTFPSEQVIFADNDVFEIFTFPFIIGDPESAFQNTTSLVIAEAAAIRLFGNDWQEQEILGKTVSLKRDGQQAPFSITGVMEDMPDNQHFHFEYLAPIRFIEQLFGENAINNVTGNYNWLTYLRLKEGADPAQLEKQKNAFFDKYVGQLDNGRDAKLYYDFELQPLLDIHLRSNLEGEIETNGSIQQIYIFGTVGILLLLVACVNYMNLATSHYSRRTKEVGVRKSLGAPKTELVKQFLSESLLVTVFALPLAILFVEVTLPYLNDFMDKGLELNFFQDPYLFLGLILLMILVSVASGFYPSLFLSKIDTTQALKGEAVVRSNKWNFRNWLVTFQYAVAIGLIFTLVVIESQLHFIQNSDPGYEKDQVLHLSLSRNIDNYDVFKNELVDHPNILTASYASRIPTGRLADSWGASFFQGDSMEQINFRLPFILADEDFLSTFKIDLIAGENFTKQMNMGQDSTGYYLINRTTAKSLGFENPQDAVGKKLAYGPYDNQTYKAGRILGVTEDFHFESLHSQIAPMVILKGDWNYRRICMKVSPENVQETLQHIETVWAQFDPQNAADYRFLDEMFAQQYQNEERLSTMIRVFVIISIFIGCLGLIGMVGFIIETKIKEIGIRKVLGASVSHIIGLIGTRFLILIGIGFIVALPIAYYFLSGWLNSFVYRTEITWWIILLPALVISIITALVISYQTTKAAMINPVECLKDE